MESHDPTVVNPRPASALAPSAGAADVVDSISLNDGVILDDFDVSVADPDSKRIAAEQTQTVEIDIPVFGANSAAGNPANQVIDEITADAFVSKIANAKKAPKAAVKAEAEAVAAVAMSESAATSGSPATSEPATTSDLLSSIETSVTEKPVDGIEILIKLAASGDIDPKNIDIIDVTDKFLKAIAAAPKENLRQSGKIIFHASVLLRMKAEALLAAASAELDAGGDDFIDFDETMLAMDTDQPRQITLKDLEKALVRRTNNKQNRQRKVTLQQLIDALKEAEKLEKERLEKKPRQRISTEGYIDVRDVEDILELAHDEDIEVTIAKVDRLLEESIKVGDALTLLKLITMLGPKSDWVDAFLAILFLSNAGKIILEQEEFYGPVQIIRAEEVAFGQAFKVTGVDHSTPEQLQIQQAQERPQPPKPRRSKKAQIEIPIPTENVIEQ